MVDLSRNNTGTVDIEIKVEPDDEIEEVSCAMNHDHEYGNSVAFGKAVD